MNLHIVGIKHLQLVQVEKLSDKCKEIALIQNIGEDRVDYVPGNYRVIQTDEKGNVKVAVIEITIGEYDNLWFLQWAEDCTTINSN